MTGHDRLARLAHAVAGRDLARFRDGPLTAWVVNRSDLVHQVLGAQADAFAQATPLDRPLRPLLGAGLLLGDGAAARRQRRMLLPLLGPRRLAACAATFVDYADRAPAVWATADPLDLTVAMRRLTLQAMGSLIFDLDDLPGDALGAALTRVLDWTDYRAGHPWALPLPWPTAPNRAARADLAAIEHRIVALVDARRRAREPRDDFLSLLLRTYDEDGSTFSEIQIRDEALGLLVAGAEWPARALTWCWVLLATHPDVAARLQHEVDSVLAGRAPTLADLPDLPYLDRVLRETLRLYPPVYWMPRLARHDVALDDVRIRGGELVLIAPYTLHRRPDYYPEPDAFDPDRWAPEVEADLPRYAYLPWGAGARHCLGEPFALQQTQLLLATLAAQVCFTLLPGQGVIPVAGLTLAPRAPCWVTVEPRPAPVPPALAAPETPFRAWSA